MASIKADRNEKTLAKESVEIKQRNASNAELVKLTEAVQALAKK
ncbi:MAG: hypothetical protein Q7R91_02880 [bacterium]|nr:hypothetical protein [bacterium]